MFKTFKNISIIVPILLLSILVSCKGGKDKTENQQNDSTDIKKDTLITKNKIKNTFYKIPSPAELFFFLKEEKATFNANALNPVSNKTKYNTTQSKAINFGIYAADIAYCSSFEKNQETQEYFVTAKEIANDLGLVEGFDKNITKRLENNLNNNDSLFHIANEAYWISFSFLEKEDKTNILPYIIVGNWIESVYLAINSVNKFSAENRVIHRIADQDLVLDNLLAYLNMVDNKKELEEIIIKLGIILRTFEERYDKTDNRLDEELFKKITLKISNLRKEFVS